MAKLEAYDKTLDYSYAPGIFPATECLKNAKKRCMRLLVSSNGLQSEGVQALEKAAQEAGDTDKVKKYSALLYAQAQLIEGLPVDDPSAYAEAVCSLMK